MKIVLFAYRNMGFRSLEYLLEKNLIPEGVIIPYEEDKDSSIFHSITKLSEKNELNFFRHKRKHNDEDLHNFIKKLEPDFGFSCYFPSIIDNKILNLFKYNVFNIHGGILPDYRGALSSVWSIINDEKYSGSTIHYINENIDMGNIIEKKKCNISNDDTGYSLYKKVENVSLELFIKYINYIRDMKTNFATISQNSLEGNYYSRRIPNNGLIKWKESAKNIYNFCRALNFPGFIPAQTNLDNIKFGVFSVEETSNKSNKPPGTIVNFKNKELEVCCNDYNIIINNHNLDMYKIHKKDNLVLK